VTQTAPEPTPAQPPNGRTPFVQSLARGLSVIRSFDVDHSSMTLSEVAKRSTLTRATARRVLLTLSQLGYIRSEGKTFSLTPLVLQLGYAYLSSLSLAQIAKPHLEDLSAKLSESTSVAILDRDEIVYVARVSTRRIMTVGITVGTRFPAHATSMGRVLLAGLPQTDLEAYIRSVTLSPLTPRTITSRRELSVELARVRATGWAIVDQELEVGLMSMAAPIRDGEGGVIAAVNVSLNAQTLDQRRDSLDSVRDSLLLTAAKISTDIVISS
jgi:IclR family transcriptional regulator, pca regulon regulatory protein